MARVSKLDVAPAEIRSLAPAIKPSLAASKTGYIKVRLSYLTPVAQHLRSVLLYHLCHIQPPYTEEISILMPQSKTFDLLEAFLPSFEYLQKSGIVPIGAELQSFKVCVEDDTTLAYIF